MANGAFFAGFTAGESTPRCPLSKQSGACVLCTKYLQEGPPVQFFCCSIVWLLPLSPPSTLVLYTPMYLLHCGPKFYSSLPLLLYIHTLYIFFFPSKPFAATTTASALTLSFPLSSLPNFSFPLAVFRATIQQTEVFILRTPLNLDIPPTKSNLSE